MMHIKLRSVCSLASILIFLTGPAQALEQTAPQPRLPTADLVAGMHVIKAELAITSTQQATGMMWRTDMPGNEGMLFVNQDDQVRCFWMKNTLVPLTIAYLTADGTIINLADMQPRDEQTHCSTRPARFALEMRQGWFAKRGIEAGFKLRGKPFGAN
jgi:uncharacterized membrane protein (UPF0127 family)